MNDPAPSTVPATSASAAALAPRPVYHALKRTFDVAASGTGLVVLSPLLAAAALAVRLDSHGPVMFVQQRIGRNFVPFNIFKFRTMVVDAQSLGGQITSGDDARITRVGRWLRKLKIDELPQLINVLRGDMSLVGPRPEVPKYVDMFRNDYAVVLMVRPGLTDAASIKYRDEAAILAASDDPQRAYVERVLPDKIAIARDYVAHASFLGDLRLIAQTLLRIGH